MLPPHSCTLPHDKHTPPPPLLAPRPKKPWYGPGAPSCTTHTPKAEKEKEKKNRKNAQDNSLNEEEELYAYLHPRP